MTNLITASRRAFTLIETIAVMVLLATISGVALPIIMSATDTYADAAELRRDSESLSMALDRMVRICREAPETALGTGLPDIDAAQQSTLEFADGTRLELAGSTLWLTIPDEEPSPLCQGVTALEFTYLGADGAPLDFAAGDETTAIRTIRIRLAGADLELSTMVAIRIALTAGGAA